MNKFLLTIGAVCVFLAASTATWALPTAGAINETSLLNLLVAGDDAGPGAIFTFAGGATGGYQVPTADIASGKIIMIDRSELEVARVPSVRFLAGVNDKLELGVGYEDVNIEDSTLNAWSLNAKYALPVSALDAKWAIGANYNKFDTADLLPTLNSINVYLAATKAYGENGKVSANLTYTKIDAEDSDIPNDNDFAFALAYEKAFSNNTTAGVEAILSAGNLLSDDVDGINYLNTYVNVAINEKMTGRLALSGIGKFTTTDLGIGYNF